MENDTLLLGDLASACSELELRAGRLTPDDPLHDEVRSVRCAVDQLALCTAMDECEDIRLGLRDELPDERTAPDQLRARGVLKRIIALDLRVRRRTLTILDFAEPKPN